MKNGFEKYISKFTGKFDNNAYAASNDFNDSADTSCIDEETLDKICSQPLSSIPSSAFEPSPCPEISIESKASYTPEIEIQSNKTSNEIKPRFITSADVAQILGVTQATVNNMCLKREIPFTKIGRLNRFEPDKIEAWIKQNSVN